MFVIFLNLWPASNFPCSKLNVRPAEQFEFDMLDLQQYKFHSVKNLSGFGTNVQKCCVCFIDPK